MSALWSIAGIFLFRIETEKAPIVKIDTEIYNAVWPSPIFVASIISVMGWAGTRALGLIN
jgi:hypothetical protein